MYTYFLSEIRKERTVVFPPDKWNVFVNEVVIDWVKTKLPEHEFNQKRIDDLEAIKVITDGLQYPYIYAESSSGGYNLWSLPKPGDKFPSYMHGISASFLWKLLPVKNTRTAQPPDPQPDPDTEPGLYNPWTVSVQYKPDWVDYTQQDIDRPTSQRFGKVLRSDVRYTNRENPYRKEDGEFIYFEIRGGKLVILPEDNAKYNLLVLEYYRYPREIKYDEKTDIPGSFSSSQNKEIMDMAVTRYLERTTNPRIQTQPAVSGSVPK